MDAPNAKPTAAGIGAAVATLVWTLIGSLSGVGTDLGEAGLASVTGASAIIVGGILFYLIPAGTSYETEPVPEDGGADEPPA